MYICVLNTSDRHFVKHAEGRESIPMRARAHIHTDRLVCNFVRSIVSTASLLIVLLIFQHLRYLVSEFSMEFSV